MDKRSIDEKRRAVYEFYNASMRGRKLPALLSDEQIEFLYGEMCKLSRSQRDLAEQKKPFLRLV